MLIYECLRNEERNAPSGTETLWIMAPWVQAKRGTYWPISCPHLVEPLFGLDPHPSPRNPTRDDLASTRAAWLDATRSPLSAARGRGVTLMWLRFMTEWICDTLVCALEMQFRREREREDGGGGGLQSDVTSGIVCQSVHTFFSNFKPCLEFSEGNLCST